MREAETESRQPSRAASRRPKQSARIYATWLLGRREWSAKELEQRLKFKEFTPDEIQDCLTFLQAHGLQDDARFAEMRVHSKSRVLGNRRLKQDLANKGVSADLVEQQMQGLPNESERAWQAAARFQGKELTPELNGKIWRFLMSRGFGSDAIKATLKQLAAPTK